MFTAHINMPHKVSVRIRPLNLPVNSSYDTGFAEGCVAGEALAHDRFWDSFQDFGHRTSYKAGFSGQYWNDDTFYPKYDMIPVARNGSSMFEGSGITDLAGRLARCGVVLDTSQMTTAALMFKNSRITHIPQLDLRNAIETNQAFAMCKDLEIIDAIVCSPSTSLATGSQHCFMSCNKLRHLILLGVFSKYLDVSASPLDKESIISIVICLDPDQTDKYVRLSLEAVNVAFESAPGSMDGAATDEWLELIGTKPTWKFELV